MGNPFIHLELNTDDPGKAKHFFQELFDWSFEDVPMGPDATYTLIRTGGEAGGGIFRKPTAEMPTTWLTYVHVNDLHATVEKALALGAQVPVRNVEAAGMGTFAILIDPTGAALGLWQPAARPAAPPAPEGAAHKPAAKPAAKKPAAKKPAPDAAKAKPAPRKPR
jgi:uncharacterized protein